MVATAPVPGRSITSRHRAASRHWTLQQQQAYLERWGVKYHPSTEQALAERAKWDISVAIEATSLQHRVGQSVTAHAGTIDTIAQLLAEVLRLRLELEEMKQQRDVAIQMCAAAEKHQEFLREEARETEEHYQQQILDLIHAYEYGVAYQEAMES